MDDMAGVTGVTGVAGFVRRHGPRLVLAAGVVVFYVFFARHLELRHDRFGTFDYDLGIWDQSVWLLARGHTFNTIRGLDVFGFHATPALVLFAPFSWLGAGPTFLNSVMAASVALGAVPVFRLARRLLDAEWPAVALAVAYLLHFSTQWMTHATFHPEVMAVTPLLCAWLAASEQRWRAFAWWAVLAVAWKEDVAVVVAMMGLVVAWRGERRRGLATFGAAVSWMALVVWVIIPARSPAGTFYLGHYGHLGDGVWGLVDTAITNPTAILRWLGTSDAFGYFRDLLAPYGFAPLLAPGTWLIGGASAVLNLLAFPLYSWRVDTYYAALPLAGATIAMVHGVARPTRADVRRFRVGLVLVSALATSMAWGIAWYGERFDDGHWPRFDSPRYEVQERAVAMVPDGAGVSASYLMVAHLSHREHVYTFPNPWVPSNWGVGLERPPDPADVSWLVVDTAYINDHDRHLLHGTVLADEAWSVVSDEQRILVARRTGSG